jgi:hypothetical protein
MTCRRLQQNGQSTNLSARNTPARAPYVRSRHGEIFFLTGSIQELNFNFLAVQLHGFEIHILDGWIVISKIHILDVSLKEIRQANLRQEPSEVLIASKHNKNEVDVPHRCLVKPTECEATFFQCLPFSSAFYSVRLEFCKALGILFFLFRVHEEMESLQG